MSTAETPPHCWTLHVACAHGSGKLRSGERGVTRGVCEAALSFLERKTALSLPGLRFRRYFCTWPSLRTATLLQIVAAAIAASGTADRTWCEGSAQWWRYLRNKCGDKTGIYTGLRPLGTAEKLLQSDGNVGDACQRQVCPPVHQVQQK